MAEPVSDLACIGSDSYKLIFFVDGFRRESIHPFILYPFPLDCMAFRIVQQLIPAPHGHLEAVIFAPTNPIKILIAMHPHPLHGGTMHNKVTYALADAGRESGYLSIRFNFRGVGKSTGDYGGTFGEAEDLLAVLDWCQQTYGPLPTVLSGFSFGSRTLLNFLRQYAFKPEKLIFTGLPVTFFGLIPESFPLPAQTLFIQGDRDEFVTPEAMKHFLIDSGWSNQQLVIVPDCDHFFNRHIHILKQQVADFLTH